MRYIYKCSVGPSKIFTTLYAFIWSLWRRSLSRRQKINLRCGLLLRSHDFVLNTSCGNYPKAYCRLNWTNCSVIQTNLYLYRNTELLSPCHTAHDNEDKAPVHTETFSRVLHCLLFPKESRTTSSLLETIQKRRKTFVCIHARGLIYTYTCT